VQACGTIEDALKLALRDAAPDDVLCAFGSLYQIGAIRAYFGLANKEEWHE
jgi:dihydrofolate synthase/folylpolyglutamate synthase